MKAIGILLVALTLAACSSQPYVVEPVPLPAATSSRTLYVVSHGWHAGLVIPAADLNQAVPELKERFGNAAYYEIGWGDKGFYQAQEITAGLTLQAMFWSEGAIMHMVALPVSPRDYFPDSEVVDTCVTGAELDSLKIFVANSFARDAAGRIVKLRGGIYGDSQFYDGIGSYYLLNTCNKWTAKGLRSAGFDISPTFKLTSGSVIDYLKANRRECANSVALGGAREALAPDASAAARR